MPKVKPEILFSRAAAVHANKFSYGPFIQDPKGRGQLFTVICPTHGEFLQSVTAHLKGNGCKKCAMEVLIAKNRLTLAEIAEKTKKFNFDYEYVRVDYCKDKNPTLHAVCKKHGPFQQDLYNHLSGKGCRACGVEENRDSLESYEAKGRAVHGDKYEYKGLEWLPSEFDSRSPGGLDSWLTLVCKEHGEFKQGAHRHLVGDGCPQCGKLTRAAALMLPDEEILEGCNVDQYKPLRVLRGKDFSGHKVVALCEKHGEFVQAGYSRRKGQACPRCANLISSVSVTLGAWLESVGVKVDYEVRLVAGRNFSWDLVLPDYKLAIETHGVYWHSDKFTPPSEHLDKHKLGLACGYRTLHIFDDEWKYKTEIVKRTVLQTLKLATEKKVSARKCTVLQLTIERARNFLEANHIQGFAPASAHFGLYSDEELIAVSSIACKERGRGGRKSTVHAELVRYSTSASVRGGLGKLLSAAQRQLGYKVLTTFSDTRIFEGGVYEKLGFSLVGTLRPDYFYIYNGRRVHKSSVQKSRIKARAEQGLGVYSESATEAELAKLNGYYRVYDCGKKVWQLTY